MERHRRGSPNLGRDMIEVQALSKSFGRVPAVTELSFQVAAGEVFGLLGPNGAGKTHHPAHPGHAARARPGRSQRRRLRHSHAGRAGSRQHRRRQRRHGTLRPAHRSRGAALLRHPLRHAPGRHRAPHRRAGRSARPRRHPRPPRRRLLERHETEDRHRPSGAARSADHLLRRSHQRPRCDGPPGRARLRQTLPQL